MHRTTMPDRKQHNMVPEHGASPLHILGKHDQRLLVHHVAELLLLLHTLCNIEGAVAAAHRHVSTASVSCSATLS